MLGRYGQGGRYDTDERIVRGRGWGCFLSLYLPMLSTRLCSLCRLRQRCAALHKLRSSEVWNYGTNLLRLGEFALVVFSAGAYPPYRLYPQRDTPL